MLSQKTLPKKFFTRTGEEVFRVVEVFEQVTLVNLESRLRIHVRLGTSEAKEFMPIKMPLIRPAPAAKTKKTKTEEPKTKKTRRGGHGKNAGWGSSKYRGVSLNKRTGKFRTVITRKGVRWEGGEFDTEELAAAAVAEHLGDLKEAARLRAIAGPAKSEQKPRPVQKKKRGTSKYLGVSLNKKSGKYRAQISRGKYWCGGEFESEELAAAAVQEKLGNTELAAELREKARTEEKIAGLRGPKLSKWMCHGCGATYDKRPQQCGKCNCGVFEKV